MSAPAEFGTTIAGVPLAFAAMNASGSAARPEELRALAASRTGAIVLKTSTVHPFVHPEFRSLHNPGFDKIVPMVRELTTATKAPVIASIAGTAADEYALLGKAFADAGARLVEVNVADPYLVSIHSPFDAPGTLRELLGPLAQACPAPLAVKLPDRLPMGAAAVAEELAALGIGVIVIKNDFTGLEKFLLEAKTPVQAIAVGGIQSGYDVLRALSKGAVAVQVGSALLTEGPAIFSRLEREMRVAREAGRA